MNTIDIGQRRAKAGGEIGANGEWYEGGEFIATSENTIKGGALKHEPSAAELAERAERLAREAAEAEKIAKWLASRVDQFAQLLAVLEYRDANAAPTYETFWQSLGRQLRSSGSLSAKQARYACKAMFGRMNKHNAEAWEALETSLTQPLGGAR